MQLHEENLAQRGWVMKPISYPDIFLLMQLDATAPLARCKLLKLLTSSSCNPAIIDTLLHEERVLSVNFD